MCVSFWINIAAILKIDMFAKGNPLGFSRINWWDKCIEYSACITCLFSISRMVTFVVAMLIGVHFIPYVWIYESKSYGLLSVGTVFVTSVCGILLQKKDLLLFHYPLQVFIYLLYQFIN